MATNYDLTIRQGSTFSQVLRWEATPYVYVPIQSISKAAPATITSTAHGLPEGWRVAFTGVKGPTSLNASSVPPQASDYYLATVVDVDTIELNSVSTLDATAHTANTGSLIYMTPVDMAGYVARMTIRDRVGGVVLASTEAAHSPLNVITVTIDNSAKTITVTIDATDTADFAFKSGVYDLEVVSPGGVVTTLLYGKVAVTKEVTT